MLGLVNLKSAFLLVTAIEALAFFVADPSLGEALAVHLEAVDFGAFAALLVALSRRQVHLGDGADEVFVAWGLVVFFDELVEEVFVESHFALIAVEFMLGDEFE